MVESADEKATEGGRGRDPRRMFAEGSGLYLIVTRPTVTHEALVSEAVRLSVPVVQLREKEMDDRSLLELATRLTDMTRESHTLFVVNDRPDIALRSGADGAHVGRGDTPVREARKLLGERRLVGASGNTVREASEVRAAGADYLGVGPVFPTATKPDAREPVGIEGLRGVVSETAGFPAVAVGGIDLDTARAVMTAGARYVAVVSAICHVDDPLAEMGRFVERLGGRG